MKERSEYMGYWWLPGDAERWVPGTVSIDDENRAELSTLGPLLERPGEVRKPLPAITGISDDGKRILLMKCRYGGGTSSYPGIERQRYDAHLMAVGLGQESDEAPLFRSLRFRFTDIDAWVNRHGFKVDTTRLPFAADMHYELPEALEYEVPGYTLKLKCRARAQRHSDHRAEYHLVQHHWISIEPPTPLPIEALWERAINLRNFFSLAVGRPTHFEALEATTDLAVTEYEGRSSFDRVSLKLRGVSVPSGMKPLSHDADMLLPFRAIREDFGEQVAAWIRSSEVIQPALDLYFGTLYDDAIYPERHFLFLAQAVETYHRRTSDETVLPAEEHEKRLNEILSATPATHRNWLEGRLAFSNEISLRRRLKDMHDRFTDVFAGYIDKQVFTNHTVNTRNYLTHYSEDLKERAASGIELIDLVFKLRTLLEACFLSDLGLGNNRITSLLEGRIVERKVMILRNSD